MTVPFLTASLLGLLFSDMVRVVNCHARVSGLNPVRPKKCGFLVKILSFFGCFLSKSVCNLISMNVSMVAQWLGPCLECRTKHPGTKHPMPFFDTPDKTSHIDLPPRTKHLMQFLSPRTKHPMPFLPPRTKHPMPFNQFKV